MSKGLAFSAGRPRIEATPDGINFSTMNNEGLWQHSRVLSYSAAIQQLDDGAYDEDLAGGLEVVHVLWGAQRNGYYVPVPDVDLLVWRWLVSSLFVIEQMEKNGMTEAVNLDGEVRDVAIYCGKNGSMTIFPRAERLTLANHIEALALEQYGAAGIQIAIDVYRSMLEAARGGLRLTASASGMLSDSHDDFIHVLNTTGVPEAPVAH